MENKDLVLGAYLYIENIVPHILPYCREFWGAYQNKESLKGGCLD